jgi:hypothetical protein
MSDDSWELFNENLPNTTVMELEIVYGSNTLRAATWGRGLWEYSLDGRENFPSILTTAISNKPTDTQPKEGIDQFVISTIESGSDLSNVFVEWSTQSNSATIQMSNNSDNLWISDSAIPNFEAGTKLFFKVFAESVEGLLSETYSFMYEIKEAVLCTPSMNCDYNDGFQLFQLADIINESGCEGYGDFTSITTELEQGSEYQLTVTTGYGDQYIKVWIDYNDDLDFTEDELLVNNHIIAAGEAAGQYTEIIDINIPQDVNLGEHILRAKANWSGDVPIDPCIETTYGETEDYTVIIVEESLGLIENNFPLNPIMYPNPTEGNISVDLRDNYSNIIIELTDILGRKIKTNSYVQGQYFNLNINEEAGIYFLTVIAENKKVVFRVVKN